MRHSIEQPRGRNKHISFFNINILAPTPNTPFWAPRKKQKKRLCASWERTQKRDPHKLSRGDFWVKKRGPKQPFSATKSLVYCFFHVLRFLKCRGKNGADHSFGMPPEVWDVIDMNFQIEPGAVLQHTYQENQDQGRKKVPQRACATKMLPNFRVNFLVRFASKPLFYWVLPSKCSEIYLVLFVRFFGHGVLFWPLKDTQTGRGNSSIMMDGRSYASAATNTTITKATIMVVRATWSATSSSGRQKCAQAAEHKQITHAQPQALLV